MKKTKEKNNEYVLNSLGKSVLIYLATLLISIVIFIFCYYWSKTYSSIRLYCLEGLNLIIFLLNRALSLKENIKTAKNDMPKMVSAILNKISGILFVVWWSIFLCSIGNFNIIVLLYSLIVLLMFLLITSLFNLFVNSKFFNLEECILALFAIIFAMSSFLSYVIEKEPIKDLMTICLCISCLLLTMLLIKAFICGNPQIKDLIDVLNLCTMILFTIVLTIYGLYKLLWVESVDGTISDNSLFTAVLGVYAAIVGGGLTLAGVAWTIRKSESNRREDLQRLENERKEEERRKYSPVFSVVRKNIETQKCVVLNLDDIENIDKVTTQNWDNTNIKLQPICVENSSKVEFYIYGILFDDDFYATPEKILMKKDYYFIIHFLKALRFTRNYEIFICVEDLIENKYVVKLNTVIKDNIMYVKGNGQLQLIEENNE